MKKTKWIAMLMILGGLLALPGVTKAAASFRQVKKFKTNSITIRWDDMTSRVSTTRLPATIRAYRVDWFDPEPVKNTDGSYKRDTKGNLVYTKLGQSKVMKASTRKYTINGLEPNTTYRIKLLFSYKNDSMTKASTVSLSQSGFFTTPGATTVTAYNHGDNMKGLKVKWEPVAGTSSVRYQYQIIDYNGKQLKKSTCASNILSLKSFKYYTRACKIRVRAYHLDDNNKKYYGAWSDYMNIVPQPIITSGQCKSTSRYKVGIQSDGTLVVEWRKVYGATGYIIYVATSQKGTYTRVGHVTVTASSRDYLATRIDSYKGNLFQKNKNYYVRVIAETEKLGESAPNYCVRMARTTN